ncbi:MAG: L,D-transpeptidase, partial [Hyphomicrobiales bacterium]
MMRTGLFAAFLLACVTLLPAAPAAAQSSQSDTMLPSVDELRPGQFVWYPHFEKASTAGPVSIIISIPQQRA